MQEDLDPLAAPTPGARRAWPPAALGHALGTLVAIALPAAWMWNFTVDDALISIRYAHHLATGLGYRFNPAGPVTDGVTPLPWPLVLAPLAHGPALATLRASKVLGLLSLAPSLAWLGWTLPRASGASRTARLLLVATQAVFALCFPVAAWAVSGMETGLATALATCAATALFARPNAVGAAFFAGLAASLRPELAPWAVAIGVGTARPRSRPFDASIFARRLLPRALLALGPFALCVALRAMMFGRPAPLALLAKPSDLAHGSLYAGAAVVVVLLPTLLLSRHALQPGPARVLTIAFAVHTLVVIGVGGDWMPYARLLVPVVPGLLLVVASVLRADARGLWSGVRLVLAATLGLVLLRNAAPAGRRVGVDRSALIERAAPVLADARVIAALDVGWVSAARDAEIVDLAGLTDPAIAALPGGHTSKRMSTAMLLDRGVDTVLVFSRPRTVELRIVQSDLFEANFREVARLPLGPEDHYVVYRRSRP